MRTQSLFGVVFAFCLENAAAKIHSSRASDDTLESGIDVGQGINVGPGKFVKKNKRRCLFCFKQNRIQNVQTKYFKPICS